MKLKTKDMILVGIFASLGVVGAKISIPIPPVPVTLQLFVCCFAGMLLGSKLGLLSQIVYILIGLAGLPVFAGASSGPAYMLSPTFGYVIGFALAAYTVGKISEKNRNFNIRIAALSVYSGIAVTYLIGVPYLYFIIKLYMGKNITVMYAIEKGLLPFIVKDILLGAVLTITAAAAVPALIKSGLYKKSADSGSSQKS